MNNEKTLEFRGSNFLAVVPFLIFIVITITLSFFNAADLNMMIGAGVIGLLVGMVLAKDIGYYWDVVLEGLGSKIGMTAVMLWLIVGIYGSILKSGQIAEGLVWLGVKLNVSGAVFTGCAFIFAAIFAMATGSGFGTISTMSAVLFPAGILLGSNPAVLAGAILSGAALGDNLAPVSDTTIIAATSQEYLHKEGTADIGGTVKTRTKYVLTAAVIALVFFFIFGGHSKAASDSAQAAALLEQYQNPMGLLLLIPTLIVIIMAVKGCDFYASLTVGIVVAIAIGLVSGLFTFDAIFRIEDGAIHGAIADGVAGMLTVSILLMIVVAMGTILIKSGCMGKTVDWLNDKVIKSPRGAELSIFALSTLFSILIAAINTIANICVAPFVNAIGRRNQLHPHRTANILAMCVCSFPFFLPFGGCILLLLGGIDIMRETYTFLPELAPTAMMGTTFYCWAILLVAFVCCLTGWGRAFEGEHGEEVAQPLTKVEK